MAAKDYAAQQNSLFGGSIIAIDTIGDNVICASRTPVMARCHRFATSGDCCFVGAHFSSQIIFYARESAKLEGFICDSTGGLDSIGSRVSKSTFAFYRRNEITTSYLNSRDSAPREPYAPLRGRHIYCVFREICASPIK